MNLGLRAKRVLALTIITALFASYLVAPLPVAAQTTTGGIIVFDYTHGQYSGSVAWIDEFLDANLTAMGYECVWAYGGINASVLENATGLVMGSVYGSGAYSSAEITAITNWYNAGSKFLWVGYDSDYDGEVVNDNMTLVLDAVGSHIYGEPTAVEDDVSNCGSGYRAVANGTSTDPYVADIVAGVDNVLMHGPTLVYGATDAEPFGSNTVALENTTVANVYPLIYYGAGATIVDPDLRLPYAHDNGQTGAFCAAALEIAGTNAIIVSGASPYGDYRPMYADEYYGVTLTGNLFVKQAIDFGMTHAMTPPADMTMLLVAGGIGVVVVILVAVYCMRKK